MRREGSKIALLKDYLLFSVFCKEQLRNIHFKIYYQSKGITRAQVKNCGLFNRLGPEVVGKEIWPEL